VKKLKIEITITEEETKDGTSDVLAPGAVATAIGKILKELNEPEVILYCRALGYGVNTVYLND
jgi:hypothetical protein